MVKITNEFYTAYNKLMINAESLKKLMNHVKIAPSLMTNDAIAVAIYDYNQSNEELKKLMIECDIECIDDLEVTTAIEDIKNQLELRHFCLEIIAKIFKMGPDDDIEIVFTSMEFSKKKNGDKWLELLSGLSYKDLLALANLKRAAIDEYLGVKYGWESEGK